METPELEKILKAEKSISLSADEKRSIKTALLDHAQQSLTHEARLPAHSWFSWRTGSAFSLALICLAFIGTGYASTSSLPGEPLYAMKVHITEEAISYTKFRAIDQATYEITRLETRLGELKELSQKESVDPADLEAVSEQISDHIAEAASAVEETSTTTYTHKDRIDTLTKLGGVMQAHEALVESEASLSPLTEAIDAGNTAADESLEEAVSEFAGDESAETLQEYLSDQITEVGEELESNTIDAQTEEEAINSLHDADDSLSEGDTKDALLFVLDAQQQIAADEYLDEQPHTAE